MSLPGATVSDSSDPSASYRCSFRYEATSEPEASNATAVLYTRSPPSAGSKTPTIAATPVSAHAAATPVQNGPSSGSAAAARSDPNLAIVASGNTARSARPSAASASADFTRARLTAGSGLTGIWHKATRMRSP